MDGMFRERKFQQYLDRLNAAKDQTEGGSTLDNIKARTDIVFEALKDDSDNHDYNLALGVLTAFILLILLFGYIKFGFWMRYLIPFVLLIFFWIYYQISMKSVYEKNAAYSNFNDPELSENYRMQNKFKYCLTGLDIKRTRQSLVMYFYMVFFPIFLFYLQDVLAGPVEQSNTIYVLLFAIALGTGFWWYFFRNEKSQLQQLQQELAELETSFLTNMPSS